MSAHQEGLKPWYMSRTIWFNGLSFLVLVASAFGFGEFNPDPKVAEYGTLVVTMVNVVLRLMTSAPLR